MEQRRMAVWDVLCGGGTACRSLQAWEGQKRRRPGAERCAWSRGGGSGAERRAGSVRGKRKGRERGRLRESEWLLLVEDASKAQARTEALEIDGS